MHAITPRNCTVSLVKTESPKEDNPVCIMDDAMIQRYVMNVVVHNELYLEIERIRQVLIRLHKTPHDTKEKQRKAVEQTSKLFRALLAARDARILA